MAQRLTLTWIVFSAVGIFATVCFFYLLLKGHRKWKATLRNNPENRMSKSKKDFINFYIHLGYNADVIDFVYCYTQKFLRAQDLVLLPTDDIINLYERNEDEWFSILNKWFRELSYAEMSEVTFKQTHPDPLTFEFLIKAIQTQKP